ncbi:IS3 family transposase [Lentisphaera marina]|uniref:IS3 family transposase n=1 Tax=Lentisphaera marina TaxID=1111041 RepID=UPI002366D8A3|nr:IS3 family transposase [Lentisphaera marina]MDD7986133.1 IS3 family transposase [Lentisphaera marina]MDD7986923.1 IS3 family transposase [Lentisphaera marina]
MSAANQDLLVKIKKMKNEHPSWGYRRVWAYLKFRKNINVNKKRIHRIMKLENLLVPPNLKLKSKRTPTRSKPRTIEPNSIWGTDMTKILIPNSGWVYLHVLIDWGSKKIIGHSLESTSRTDDWLSALHMGINNQFPNGIKEANPYLQLVSDNGCQPTSKRFISECKSLGIQQIFTSYNNPKGNADTERVIRTIKEDLVWPREWKDIYELKEELTKWIQNYNEDFPHSSLGYMTPYDYEAWFNASLVA